MFLGSDHRAAVTPDGYCSDHRAAVTPDGYTGELDDDLLDRAKSGDEKAFAEIVRRYERMVYSFSYKVCRDRQNAEEALQDTFVNVFRKLKQFDGKSKFSTWLYSIVANNCLMKRRRSKLDAASVSIDEKRTTPSGDDHLEIQSWRNTPSGDDQIGR